MSAIPDNVPTLSAPIKSIPATSTAYFNTAAFALPALGTFGNEGLNVVRMPGLNSTQFNLSKEQTFHSSLKHQYGKFEAEFFNLFNHPAYNGIGTTYGSAAFGTINSALDPRNINFKLKFSF